MWLKGEMEPDRQPGSNYVYNSENRRARRKITWLSSEIQIALPKLDDQITGDPHKTVFNHIPSRIYLILIAQALHRELYNNGISF